MGSDRRNGGYRRCNAALAGLKRHLLLSALIVSAVVILGYYAFIAAFGAHFSQVCSYDDQAKIYRCEYWDVVTAATLRSFIFLDAHNGIVTALATLVMAGFTGTLWWATIKQGRLTERALVISNRAFVFLEDFECDLSVGYPPAHPSAGALPTPTIARFSFAPRWKNSGETPTRNLVLRIDHEFIGGLPSPGYEFRFADAPMRTMLAPKANEWGAPIHVDPGRANEALAGKLKLYVWALAEYEDVFGNKRWTKTCSEVKFSRHDRDIAHNFIIFGDYNGSDADDPDGRFVQGPPSNCAIL